jgi:Carboxypeptidase regulatory-like domain
MSLLALLWLLSASSAQNPGMIAGTVSVPPGMQLTGVTIELRGENTTILPDEKGRYTLTNVTPGENTILVSGGGFVPQVRTVDVATGLIATADFTLETSA